MLEVVDLTVESVGQLLMSELHDVMVIVLVSVTVNKTVGEIGNRDVKCRIQVQAELT